jgi:hypothetical protein
MNTHTPDFGTITNFEGDETTIALMGTFKNGAAFELGAVLDAAIDRQPASMVLDAAELDFMGPAELLAVSNAERRLASFRFETDDSFTFGSGEPAPRHHGAG